MYIVSSNWTGEFKSCKVEENKLVEYPTTDPNVLVSNPMGRRGLNSCLTQTTPVGTSSHWLTQEANIEDGLE